MLTRRQFNLRSLALAIAAPFAHMFTPRLEGKPDANDSETAFPAGDYTPFGYLDNPYHCWALNRSGVLRSVRGIGFGWHYPAGPGGYFDEKKNGIYSAFLRLGFAVGDRHLWETEDFRGNELRSPYHSKNILTYELNVGGARIEASFVQVQENSIGVRVLLLENPLPIPILVMAAHQYRLGNAEWWGGDGVVGRYDREHDCLLTRSFAAGTVFAIGSNAGSKMQFFDATVEPIAAWFGSQPHQKQAISYGRSALQGGITYELVAAEPRDIIMARGENESAAIEQLRSTKQKMSQEISDKRHDDAVFWNEAPRLEGDWPPHWKNGWIYDFETLRMMVRRPVGAYKYRWDAMQIQAPRNVLAETSIDTWALSHADPESAKEVFLGQFLDAVEPNVPCMREDAVMNMVAADTSECGTSISWCYPFFCAASIYERTGDLNWLGRLYPRLAKLLRWTIDNRSDKDGFIVGKCSWETGMDSARRFLIEQPTGAELIDFIRIVELQAAAANAAGVLEQFAHELGESSSASEWNKLKETYKQRTQQLWNGVDWFHDFDTRTGKPISAVGKDIGQVAPIFCGAATSEQTHAMLPSLRAFYQQSRAGSAKNEDGWVDGLQWSSLTFPFVESLRTAGEYELLSQVVHMIAERIYPTMDRRQVGRQEDSWVIPREGEARVGIPGVSCEMWTPQGAAGGEGYGWGAVVPVHIMRNIVGLRESDERNRLWLCPNLPDQFMITGKSYLLRNWRYRNWVLMIGYSVQAERKLKIDISVSRNAGTISIRDDGGRAVENQTAAAGMFSFTGEHRKKYEVLLGSPQ